MKWIRKAFAAGIMLAALGVCLFAIWRVVSEIANKPSSAGSSGEANALHITGMAYDAASGAPITNARVFGVQAAHQTSESAYTDASGSFQLHLPEGKWSEVVCLAPGYARARHPLQESQKSDIRVEFLMQPGGDICGRITDGTSGNGLAGFQVVASSQRKQVIGKAPLVFTAKTDEEGNYLIEGLLPGAYRVSPQSRERGYIAGTKPWIDVDVVLQTQAPRADFSLELGAIVEGQIQNLDNTPVSEATVYLIPGLISQADLQEHQPPDAARAALSSGKTNANGKYRILGLDYDRPFRLYVIAPGYAEAATAEFRILPGESPRREPVVLLPGSTISGRARFANGVPASEQILCLESDPDSHAAAVLLQPKTAVTDAEGAFSFEHISPGAYLICPTYALPLGETVSPPLSVSVDGVTSLNDVKIRVTPMQPAASKRGEGVIQGRVEDPEGKAVPNARVVARRVGEEDIAAEALTSQSGAFALKRLEGALHDITVQCAAGVQRLDAVAPGANVTLRLMPLGSIAGQICDQDGNAMPGCDVLLKPDEVNKPANPAAAMRRNAFQYVAGQTKSGADGTYLFQNVEPGDYVIQADAGNMGKGKTASLKLEPGQALTDIVVAISGGTYLSGVVKNEKGRAVSNALVQLMSPPDNDLEHFLATVLPPSSENAIVSTRTDRSGAFILRGAPPGAYVLDVRHSEYAKYIESSIKLEQNSEIKGHPVTLLSGGRIEGCCLIGGKPKEHVIVQLLGEDEMQRTATDASGHFSLERLMPGEHLLNIIDSDAQAGMALFSGYSLAPRVVRVEQGKTATLDIDISKGARISGIVTGRDLDGMVVVQLRRPGGPTPEELSPMRIADMIEGARYLAGQSVVAQDGSFHIEGIQPGDYIIEVSSVTIDPEKPDFQALASADRTPRIRREVTVDESPLELNLNVPPL